MLINTNNIEIVKPPKYELWNDKIVITSVDLQGVKYLIPKGSLMKIESFKNDIYLTGTKCPLCGNIAFIEIKGSIKNKLSNFKFTNILSMKLIEDIINSIKYFCIDVINKPYTFIDKPKQLKYWDNKNAILTIKTAGFITDLFQFTKISLIGIIKNYKYATYFESNNCPVCGVKRIYKIRNMGILEYVEDLQFIEYIEDLQYIEYIEE